MSGLSRPLSLIFATILAIAPLAASATTIGGPDDAQDTFSRGVDLLRRGHHEEALRAFQQVLAMDPGHEEAYELWKSTDHSIWIQLMVEGGEFELVAKAIMGLADMGRHERLNDRDAIKAQVRLLHSDDVIERRGGFNEAADHFNMAEMGGGDKCRAVIGAGHQFGIAAGANRQIHHLKCIGDDCDGDHVVAFAIERIEIGPRRNQSFGGCHMVLIGRHHQCCSAKTITCVEIAA